MRGGRVGVWGSGRVWGQHVQRPWGRAPVASVGAAQLEQAAGGPEDRYGERGLGRVTGPRGPASGRRPVASTLCSPTGTRTEAEVTLSQGRHVLNNRYIPAWKVLSYAPGLWKP